MRKLFLTTILIASIPSLALAESGSTHRKASERRENSLKRMEYATEGSFEKYYADYKKKMQEYGITYSLDYSSMLQRTAPSGGNTAWQNMYYGSVNWDMYKSAYGDGSVQIAYTAVRYQGGKDAADIGNRAGVAQPINDFPTKTNTFAELSYTHQYKWLAVTVGQFPIYNFDGTSYDSNQQVNFMNYSLSQNGTSSYPVASLGGYATVSPSDEWSFTFGAQDAANVTGETIRTGSNDFAKRWTTFGSVSYMPQFKGLGTSQYSVLLYNQPSTRLQPENSNGWSINAMQNLNETWGVFARANGTTNSPSGIKQSYVLGAVMNNPLGRNALDQIGLAGSVNKLERKVYERSTENIIEAYWAWGVSNFMTLTPDVQMYINPGNNSKSDTAFASSIRLSIMF